MEDEVSKQGPETQGPDVQKVTDHPDTDQGKKMKKNRFRKENTEEVYQTKLAEVNDKYLRLFAEFDNFRKRTIREKAEILNFAAEELITQLLPVLDDFNRALKSMNDTQEIEAVKEGVTLISNKLNTLLEQKGLSAVESVGTEFNTDFHEAISNRTAGEENKGKVIDEIQKGYLYKGKVIRFSKVVVGN